MVPRDEPEMISRSIPPTPTWVWLSATCIQATGSMIDGITARQVVYDPHGVDGGRDASFGISSCRFSHSPRGIAASEGRRGRGFEGRARRGALHPIWTCGHNARLR